MARKTSGCGCGLALLALVLAAAAVAGYKFALPWWRAKPPAPSGKELQVHVLNVGPSEGDSILIIAPEGKTVLVDAGDAGKGKVVVDALNRYGVKHIDYLIASNSHPDHIGGIPEVLKAVKASVVIDSGYPPAGFEEEGASEQANSKPGKGSKKPPKAPKKGGRSAELPTVTAYRAFKAAVGDAGAEFKEAEPGQRYDLGGGAMLTILAPIQPFFAPKDMRTGGNDPNANSVVARLDYGDFSMLLPGDAESISEERMIAKGANVSAKILEVAHYGSKYATSDDFLKHVRPEVAIISDGEYNRYGHPSTEVLNRLKAAGVTRLYRTDLEGEITITTTGREYKITPAKEAKQEQLWAGRQAQKDDSSSRGFVAYGDFGPPPKPKPEKSTGRK